MTKVLLTGYEPFGTTPINPAELVARALDGETIADAKVVSRILPSTFFESIETVAAAIEAESPDLVIMMGEYGGRATITVERIAQNFNDSTRYGLVDNRGKSMQDEPTVPGGPAAYYATLPIRAMVKAMREAGVPADISDAPGTFCCNHLMYGILHVISDRALDIRAGWIHLPHLPEVAALPDNLGAPSMSAQTATKGVRVGIEAALTHAHDITDPISSRLQI